MSLPDAVCTVVQAIGVEIFETFAADGHTVDTARAAHPAFSSPGSQVRSSAQRDLVYAATSRAARANGADWSEANNSRTVAVTEWPVRYVFRVLTAERLEDGTFRVLAAGDPFNGLDVCGESMLRDEAWVLGTVRNETGVTDAFVARIVRVTDAKVPLLELTDVMILTPSSQPPPGSFDNRTEDLDDRLASLVGESVDGAGQSRGGDTP